MTTWQYRNRRKEAVRARAKTPDDMNKYCRAIGCSHPARAGTSDGLGKYCRKHSDHYKRHGRPFKGSYPAKTLNPYRRAALAWLMANPDNRLVRHAVGKIVGLYRRAGPHVEAFRLRGLSPQERAKALWARLRKAEVDPRLPVAAWLAVEMVIRDDIQPVQTTEFKRVQGAKIVHRMGGGTIKRWAREIPRPPESPFGPPRIHVTELRKFPRSEGRVLQHIGMDLEEAVELLVDDHLEEIRAFKYERDRAGSFDRSPYPSGVVAKRRMTPEDDGAAS